MMISFGVSLLSGGLDSTTVTAYARGRVDRLTALTFHYGQTHSKEIECAKRVAGKLHTEHKLLDVSSLRDAAWYSALTNPDLFAIPLDKDHSDLGLGIPITYVPLRNTVFIALSAAFLESQILQAIEVDGLKAEDVVAQLYIASNAVDYSGYPDCRPEFVEQMARTLDAGSKLSTEYRIPIEIATPVIDLTKAEITELGVRLKAPLEYTGSCYGGDELPCGECDSCILRAKGFAEAGIIDPLLSRLSMP